MGFCYPVDGLVITGQQRNLNCHAIERVRVAIETLQTLNDDTRGHKFRPAEHRADGAPFSEWVEAIHRDDLIDEIEGLLDRKGPQGTLVVASYEVLLKALPQAFAKRLGLGQIAVIALDLIDMRRSHEPDFMNGLYDAAHRVASGLQRKHFALHDI